LERVVASFNKRAILVKVNIDKDRDTARHWGVRNIPSVKIVKQGKVVKEFKGDLPEFAIKMLLARAVSAEEGVR
jgi:putative thioredoxin